MTENVDTDWQALILRLSVFPIEKRDVVAEDWTLLTGLDRPESQLTQQFGVHFLGPAFGGRLQMSSTPGRIDIVLLPGLAAPADSPPGAIRPLEPPAFLGDFFQILEIFRAGTMRWLRTVSFGVNRVAFGATILNPRDNELETYKALGSFLKSVRVVPEKMKDLVFCVNWRLPSKAADGVVLNRLTKWSSVSLQSSVSAQPSFVLVQGPSLEIDFSTPAEFIEPLTRDALCPIYEELIRLAVENAHRGEVTCQ